MNKTQKTLLYWMTAVGLSGALLGVGLDLLSRASTILNLAGLAILGAAGVWWAGRIAEKPWQHWGLALVLALGVGTMGCGRRIEPGHAGILVHLYGGSKGVDIEPLHTGMVWYNPMTKSVFEYPTYVQTAVWTRDPNEGSENNEELSFNTLEGMVITADISLSYSLQADKVPEFFAKFRTDDLSAFTHGFMHNVARDAFNESAVKYTVEQVYGEHKEALLKEVRARINQGIEPYGVTVEQFGFIGAPRLPEAVVEALNSKIKATQDAIRVENELRQTRADAQKAIAKAEGTAKARLTVAQAEASANRLIADSLTPELVQYQAIKQWDGKRPQVEGTNSGLLVGLAPRS